jgi:hypothetical protein
MRYTIDDYLSISFEIKNNKLSEEIMNKIQILIKELNINTSNYNQELKNNTNNDNKFVKCRYISKQSRYVDIDNLEGRTNKTDELWKTNYQFKTTKIEKKEGIEKTINDIRISLNKISIKNYEQQKEIIFQLIKELVNTEDVSFDKEGKKEDIKEENKTIKNAFQIFSEEDDEDEELKNNKNEEKKTIEIKKIAQCIFDIASSNKFYSELYAKLYKELIKENNIFNIYVINLIEEYKQNIDNIKNVDSNKDYDSYCENNKLNDKRKALTSFIVNLMKEEILLKKDVYDLIIFLQEKLLFFIEVEDKIYQVDEITENIFILITLVANQFENIETTELKDKIENIKENIIMFSKYKTKEHKSISSRAIFKYMDMKELILKNQK